MKITYKLSKDDYMDFVKYEASFRDNPVGRKKFFGAAVGVCVCVCAAEYLLGTMLKYEGTAQLVQLSAVMSIVVFAGLFGMMSEKNRLKSLYVKYGFNRVEKAKSFPKITIDFRDENFTLSSDKSSEKQTYKYEDIQEIVTLEHIVMLKTGDKLWQFISKKAFANKGDLREFIDFLNEKNENIVTGATHS